MSNILDPHERIKELDRQIASKQAAIKKANASYDALCHFKTEVERSQGDFDAVNGKDSQVLEPLAPLQAENSVIDKYAKGMNRSLNNIGAGVVGHTFSVLLGMISLELKAIYRKVEQYENEISWLNTLRREAEAEIRLMNSNNG